MNLKKCIANIREGIFINLSVLKEKVVLLFDSFKKYVFLFLEN